MLGSQYDRSLREAIERRERAGFQFFHALFDAGALITPLVIHTPSTSLVTLTFSGPGILGGSLADGNYELQIEAAKLKVGTNSLDINGDGSLNAADDVFADFHRWFGDADGDRDVDAADNSLFQAAFYGIYNSIFDVDADGDVDGTDNAQFRRRFLKTLPPPTF